jgi:hypothetical protein
MPIYSKKTRVPDSVLEAAKKAGGSVAKIPGEDLCCVRCEFGDACYNVLNEWVSTLDEAAVAAAGGPRVTAIFAPPPRALGTALCPRFTIAGAIQVEASSIVHHYAPLRSGDFAEEDAPPALPAPLAGAVHHVAVRHAHVALHALQARIRSVNDPNYPALSELPGMSYVCDVCVEWANASVVTSIFKP